MNLLSAGAAEKPVGIFHVHEMLLLGIAKASYFYLDRIITKLYNPVFYRLSISLYRYKKLYSFFIKEIYKNVRSYQDRG